MAKLYSYTQEIEENVVDAFCSLEHEFTDQFAFYEKQPLGQSIESIRLMGLGRCIAVNELSDLDYVQQGPEDVPAYSFSFQRFDEENPKPTDELFRAFPKLGLMFPEIVLAQIKGKTYLQVNSLGPVYQGRVDRFMARIGAYESSATDVTASDVTADRTRLRKIPYTITRDSLSDWKVAVSGALHSIRSGQLDKVVLARRCKLDAGELFTSTDVLLNLIQGPNVGCVIMYRYDDIFFIGCTPELLVRKHDANVETMCLAGTCGVGRDAAETERMASELMHDAKNRHEHAIVTDFMRQDLGRICYDVNVPSKLQIKRLSNVQHLYTPVTARLLQGASLQDLVRQLHPTPALSGQPVGESLMLIRRLESFNRGFFGGPAGYVDSNGDGEFSVAIRSGVFDGHGGWVYAGCGIVDGSVAEDEYAEIDMKLKAILAGFDPRA